MNAVEVVWAMLDDVQAVADAREALSLAQRQYTDYLLGNATEKAWAETRAVGSNPEVTEGKNESIRSRALALTLAQDPVWTMHVALGRNLEVELERARNDYRMLVELQQARRYVVHAEAEAPFAAEDDDGGTPF